MATITLQLYLGLVLHFVGEAGRWLVALQALRGENYLVHVRLVVHLQEALVVDGKQVYGLREVQDQTENLAPAM